jgi:small subunit ribosomal protein S9
MPTAAKKTKKVSKPAEKPVRRKAEKVVVPQEPKVEAVAEEKEKFPMSSEKYFFSIGKRKTSVAQVRLYESKEDALAMKVNGRELPNYFPVARLRDLILAPLVNTSQEKKVIVSAKVSGGGSNSQAEAIRLGIARALVKRDENFKKQLKDLGFLTRDARKVERKKPGLKKARRGPQWAKR